MKKIFVFLAFLPTICMAQVEIQADQRIQGSELIEIVRREGKTIDSSYGTSETYQATITCTKDRLNSQMSYCRID